jgi:hypothetical protein
MADIVMGISSAHTPLLRAGVYMWHDHAERDRRSPRLLGTDARYHIYSELLAEPDRVIEKELGTDVKDGEYQRRQRATRGLTGSPRATAPGGALDPRSRCAPPCDPRHLVPAHH